MDNIRNINANLVTPVDVIVDLQEKIHELKEIYVVAFDNGGRPQIWASGNLKAMALAAVILHAKTVDVVHDGGL